MIFCVEMVKKIQKHKIYFFEVGVQMSKYFFIDKNPFIGHLEVVCEEISG